MAAEIFISHISEEEELAEILRAAIEADFTPPLRVFASSSIANMQAGRIWLDDIKVAVRSCKMMLVLCSPNSVGRPWVNFEVGAALMGKILIVPVSHSGMTPGTLPMPMLLYEGIEASGANGLEHLYKTLEDRFKRVADAGSLDDHRKAITEFEAKYVLKTASSKVEHFVSHIDLMLPAPGRLEGEAIPPGTIVKGDKDSMRLFDFSNGDDRTWAEIEAAAHQQPDTRWLRQIQKSVARVSNGQTFKPVQSVYHHTSGSFQPDLSRVDTHPDGSRRVHIHFVNTVVPPLADVPDDIGLLATVLRLGLRFRYEVIRKFEQRLMNAVSIEQGRDAELLAHICGAIETIETDAKSRGSERLDRDSVTALFDLPYERAEMREIQQLWDNARSCLFGAEGRATLDAARQAMHDMRVVNFRFMQMGSQRFNQMVSASWADNDG